MTRKLRALIGTAAAVLGLAIAPSIDAPAGATTIPVFLAVPATGLTVTGAGGAANLYAWASCGGEFAPLKPTVVADNPATTISPPASGNLLYGPSTCDDTQPVSEDLAVFGRNMYWVSADGYLQAAPNNYFDTPSRQYRMAQLPPLIGGGVAPGVAVDDHAITWTSSNVRGMGVYAVWSPHSNGGFAGDPQNAYESSAPLRHLSLGPFGTRLVVSGTALLGLTRDPGSATFRGTVLSSGPVTAVASDPGAVYWVQRLTDGYVIYTRRVTESRTGAISYGTVSTIKRVTGMGGSVRVNHIVVDPNTAVPFGRHDLWWSVEGTTHATDPTLVHFIRTSNSFVPLLLHSDTTSLYDIATDGSYVYWTDTAAVYRVLSSASPPHAVTTPLNIEDDSPDLPFAEGTSAASSDPGGRVADIVIDPVSPNNVYAATQYSGPWRSTNGGRTWQQSARGMATGGTDHSSKIAIDPAAPSHLLYATNDDGSLIGQTTAALYASTDSGVNWTKVSSDAVPCQVYSLAFADGNAWASAACGLYYSSDLFTWSHDTNAIDPGVPSDGAFIAGSGKSLFACDGDKVFYKTDKTAPWLFMTLPSGHCFNLTQSAFPLAVRGAPDGLPTTIFVVHQTTDNGPVGLTELHLNDNATVELGYPTIPRDPQGYIGVSGELGVWVGNNHSGGYRLFTANGNYFYEWAGGTTWDQFDGVHIDARALAFPPAFDPVNGNCTAYTASDGGVDINQTVHSDHSRCSTWQGPWVRAQHGLHAYKSSVINGVHRASCETPSHAVITPCPVLYVGSGDNGMWTRDLTQSTPWDTMHDCCGDNGGVIIDPKLPHQVYATRNGEIHFYDGGGDYVRSTTVGSGEAPPNEMDQVFPSSPSGATVVMSTTSVPAQDTKIALERYVSPSDPDPDRPTMGRDQLVISRRGGGWMVLRTLPVNSVQQLASSGGNASALVLYLRRTDGSVDRATISTGNALGTLTPISPAGANVSIMWANPYDSSELWIENDAAGDIERGTWNGTGFDWSPSADLTAFAKGYDPRFGTATYNFGHVDHDELPVNSLQNMWFPDEGSNLRIALSPYGGPAISRDGGQTWIPLGGSLPLGNWLAHPWSVWYDAAGSDGVTSDLYLALAGRGVIRVNANFDALVDVAYVYCPGGTCPSTGLAPRAAATSATASTVPSTVSLVDESEQHTIPMTLDADGNWRATELLDATGRDALHYHFVVDGVAQQSVVRPLTTAERRAGLVNALPLGPGPDPELPAIGPMTVSPSLIPGSGCPSAGQKTTVSAQITTAAKLAVDSATLAVSERTYDDNGDVGTQVIQQAPMTLSDVSTWSASVQLPDLSGADDGEGTPALVLQIEAASGAGSSLGNPVTLGTVSCPKVGSKPPSAPRNLAAKPARAAVELTWRAPASTGGEPITGYDVIAYHNGTRVAIEQFGPSVRTGLFTELRAHTGYAFAIRAHNLRGTGPWSPRTPVVRARTSTAQIARVRGVVVRLQRRRADRSNL